MMKLTTLHMGGTLLIAVAGCGGLFLLYSKEYPLDPSLALYGLITALIMAAVYSFNPNKAIYHHFLSLMTVGVLFTLWSSSLFSYYWRYESILSAESMAKLVMLISGMFSCYLAIVLVRARVSYKKKIGNQPVSKKKPRFSRSGGKEQSTEVVFTLGEKISKNK